MKKQQKQKLTLTAGGIGLVVVASLLTIGGIRLFGQTAKKDDKILNKLVHVELDDAFFKYAKRTTNNESGRNHEIFTYSIPDTDYDVIISSAVGSGETTYSFEKDLMLQGDAGYGSITITNLQGSIIEFFGTDNRNNDAKEIFSLSYSDEKELGYEKPTSYFTKTPQNAFKNIEKIMSFTIYGDKDNQPKAVTTK